MKKWTWILWGILFSAILFFALYFMIYVNVKSSPETPALKLGQKDVSFLGEFFSDIKNVIITSIVIGFLLAATILIKFRKNRIPRNLNMNINT